MPHVPNCNILSILSISKRNSGKRQVYYFVIISIQWYRTDEFQRKRKPRIIVYSSVTRYGSRASCQRKGLKSNVLQSSLSGSELYPFIFKLPRSSNLRRNKGGMARAGATTKRFPITGGRGPEAEFFFVHGNSRHGFSIALYRLPRGFTIVFRRTKRWEYCRAGLIVADIV